MPSPLRRQPPWEWLAAFVLHATVILVGLIGFRLTRPPPATPMESGVSVVFENSGMAQRAAPSQSVQGPPTVAQSPPAPSAPPAQEWEAPEFSLSLPPAPPPALPLPPVPQPQPQQAQRTPQRPAKPSHRQYDVMNGMSFGNTGTQAPASHARRGLNLQLSQADLNALDRPEIEVQGDIGQDWMADFNKWVNAHIYYPRAAAEQGQQGTSVIEFTVHRDGRVTGIHLVSSAGSTFLDQAWLGIFLQNNVPPFPAGTKSDTIKITASLQYELIR